MWKKDESEEATAASSEATDQEPGERPSRTRPGGSRSATIGPSITIDGDVSGQEDLLIQGRVNGVVKLADQSITVGSEGRVKADITGRVVTVEGEVEGNLTADEQVILRSQSHVEGDIKAPRVVLEDGASFKGLVDMSRPEGSSAGSGRSSATRSAGKASSDDGAGSKAGSSSASTSKSAGSSGSASKSDQKSDATEKAAS